MDMNREIKKAYSGIAHKGMCGCAGNWYYGKGKSEAGYQEEDPRNVTRVKNVVMNGEHEVHTDKDADCAYVYKGRRIYAIYF